jgi:hypothetical protein
MATPHQSTVVDGEREVDLGRWRRAVVALWWLPVVGLILGAIAGVLYSFRGGTQYSATALVSLGQPVSPGGAVVNSFGQNPRAISEITSSAGAQAQAAHQADMRAGALRGNVSVAQVGTATGAGASRATPLISITVTGKHSLNTAAAAQALANIVVAKTTKPYVAVKIRTYKKTLQSVDTQLGVIQRELTTVAAALKAAQKLDPLQQLVIVSQEDNAEARQGNLIAQQEALQQQLAFSENVESAKVVVGAKSVKTSAHSRTTSAVVGAIIGLILGAILAIVLDARRPRAATV